MKNSLRAGDNGAGIMVSEKIKQAEFTLAFKVRDYECDLQGVVNNAVYHNYLEHARHEALSEVGVDFAALSKGGINLVLVRSEVNYRRSLTSGDQFSIVTQIRRHSPVRYIFDQKIFLAPGGELVADAQMTGAALNEKGRPFRFDQLEKLVSAKAGAKARVA